MGNHAESPKETILVEKIVHKSLRDDDMPVLKADLDGGGKNIKNVKDVACDTINGKDFLDVFEKGLRKLLEQVRLEMSKREHTHAEFTTLRADIEHLAKNKQEKGDFATSTHSHDIDQISGSIPLRRVQDGDKLLKLVGSSFAAADHRHVDLEAKLQEPFKLIQELRTALTKKQDKEDAEIDRVDLKKKLEELQKFAETVQASIPKPVEVEHEFVASQVFIVPRKANGMKVVELATYSTDGMRIKADCPIQMGDTLSYDAFYKLPADTIVRIRVK